MSKKPAKKKSPTTKTTTSNRASFEGLMKRAVKQPPFDRKRKKETLP